MIQLAVSDQYVFFAFWLCFTRWITVLIQLPLFDNLAVPNILKVLCSFVISWAFFDLSKGPMLTDLHTFGLNSIWYLTMVHGVIGLFLGFMVKTMMTLFVAAGNIVTQQVGFASVSYFDPTQMTQVGPFERLFQWVMVILVLTSGALIPMFKGVVSSFETVNALHLEKLGTGPEYFTEMFKSIFQSAVMLSTPLILANLLMNLVFGIVARTIPQMNVLMVSFVVNIGMGLVIFMAISQEFFQVSFEIYQKHLADWFHYFN
jgi:flagellar biosynthesis protein FliR